MVLRTKFTLSKSMWESCWRCVGLDCFWSFKNVSLVGGGQSMSLVNITILLWEYQNNRSKEIK